MTTLLDGTIVDESVTAKNYTDGADVAATFGQGSRKVESITIHHWGIPGQKFADVVRYLSIANPRSSSAHAVIEAGRAASIVHPDNAAWHAGTGRGNATSIGLELRPEATDGDYLTAAAYIAMLRGVYGNIPLVPHSHWKATACPGKWDLRRLDTLAQAFTNLEKELPAVAKDVVTLSEESLTRIFANSNENADRVIRDLTAKIEALKASV